MELTPPATVRKVAIVGTGVIGAGWAALFAARGYTVVAFVRSSASREKFLKALQRTHQNYVVRGIAKDAEGWKAVQCVETLADCVSDADYVQESVVEECGLKLQIIRDIDEFAPPNVLIGSSTSFIPLSVLRTGARRFPNRVATAHPSLPHWDAFCEVLGSSPDLTAWLGRLYREGLGMDVVEMRCQRHGHVLNSLLSSVSTEATSLLNQGICSAEEVDLTLVHLGRLLVAAGGCSGAFAGFVGGGSREAHVNLVSDIVVNYPLNVFSSVVGNWFPRRLASLLQILARWLLWPWTLVRRLIKPIVQRACFRMTAPFDDRPAAVAAFEATAARRVADLEALAGATAAAGSDRC